MGWGGKGKGPGPWFGPPHHHHHRHGPGPLVAAAEVAAVGLTAAAVATAVTARPRPRRPPVVLPPQQVVVVPSTPAPAVAVVVPPKGKGKGKGKGRPPIVVQQEPLNVCVVRLPAEGMELRGSVNFFAVDITKLSGEIFRVMRRYNDFHQLSNRLGSQSFPGAPFPRKHCMGCAGQKLEERRLGLELWLQRAIENPASGGAWLQPLRQFLESGQQVLATAPQLAGVPVETPVANAPSRPAPAPEVLAPCSSEDEEMTLEITIPPGVSAGQLLGVNVPSGQQLAVPVPEGFSAGATLELFYDPKHNTLTPIT